VAELERADCLPGFPIGERLHDICPQLHLF
jgi:hypothetical protein